MSSSKHVRFVAGLITGFAIAAAFGVAMAQQSVARTVPTPESTRFVVDKEWNGIVRGHFEVNIDGEWKPVSVSNPASAFPTNRRAGPGQVQAAKLFQRPLTSSSNRRYSGWPVILVSSGS